MKVIFLDVDGVLNSEQYFKERKTKGNDIDETKVVMLKEIVDKTNASIVVSSTWRLIDTCRTTLEEILCQYGLYVYSYTSNNETGERADEVKEWLDNNDDVESFVLLDDDHFDWEKYGYEKYWVKPSWYKCGLQQEHVEQAIKILNEIDTRGIYGY